MLRQTPHNHQPFSPEISLRLQAVILFFCISTFFSDRRNCMTALLARRPFTTTKYHRMIEAGILTEKDRVELLYGEIVTLSPIGSRHVACVKRLNAVFSKEKTSNLALKLPSDARAGIAKVWLVELLGDRMEIHPRPNNGIYQEIRFVLRGQKVISQAIPQLKLRADDIRG
jgi:hypothetical protein